MLLFKAREVARKIRDTARHGHEQGKGTKMTRDAVVIQESGGGARGGEGEVEPHHRRRALVHFK